MWKGRLMKTKTMSPKMSRQMRDTLCFAAAGFAYIALAVYMSNLKPLWMDEISTLRIATMGSVRAILDQVFLGTGDPHPPLYYVLAHWCLAFLGNQELAVRLPAMLGFVLGCFFVWKLMTKEVSREAGWIAAAAMLVRGGYGWEARPYGLGIGLAAFTLYAWRNASKGRAKPAQLFALGAACALLTGCHYYAALLFVPILFAEAMKAGSWKGLNKPVCAAIVAPAVLVVAWLMPAIRVAMPKTIGFGGQLSFSPIAQAYSFLLPSFLCVAIMAVLGTTMLMQTGGKSGGGAAKGGGTRLDRTFLMCLVGLLALPVVAYLPGVYAGAYEGRYLFPVLVAMCCVVGIAGGHIYRSSREMAYGVMMIPVIALCFYCYERGNGYKAARQEIATVIGDIKTKVPYKTHFVTTDVGAYMTWHYYMPAGMRDRFHYVPGEGKNNAYNFANAQRQFSSISVVETDKTGTLGTFFIIGNPGNLGGEIAQAGRRSVVFKDYVGGAPLYQVK